MPLVHAAFETHQAVTRAVEQLLLFGFPRSAISYEADDEFRAPPPAVSRDSGLLATVTTFFAKLSGPDRTHRGTAYAAVIRRGGMVVSVDSDTAIEEQTARHLLRQAGAVDLDDGPQERDLAHAQETLANEGMEDSDFAATNREVTVAGLPVYLWSGRPVEDGLLKQSISDDANGTTRGSPAIERDLVAFTPGTFEVRERAEKLAVSKQVRVIEELTVNKSVVVHTETIRHTVRASVVKLEHIPVSQP